MGLTSLVLLGVIRFGWDVIRANQTVQAKNEIQQNARLAFTRLGSALRSADRVYQPPDSLFDAHPGILALDFPGENTNAVIDTYSKNLILAGQSVTIRKLRLTEGAQSFDLTSDRVNVSQFIVRNRTQSENLQIIHFDLGLEAVSDPNASLNLSASFTLRH